MGHCYIVVGLLTRYILSIVILRRPKNLDISIRRYFIVQDDMKEAI